MSFLAVVFQGWLVGNSLPFWRHVACIWLTCAKKYLAAESDQNIIIEGKRSVKAAKKDLSTTIVASVCSTGATVILISSVNTKCDWILARANTVSLTFTTAQLQNGSCNSTVIYPSPWQPDDLLIIIIITILHVLLLYLLPSLMFCIPSEQPWMKLWLFHGCSDK